MRLYSTPGSVLSPGQTLFRIFAITALLTALLGGGSSSGTSSAATTNSDPNPPCATHAQSAHAKSAQNFHLWIQALNTQGERTPLPRGATPKQVETLLLKERIRLLAIDELYHQHQEQIEAAEIDAWIKALNAQFEWVHQLRTSLQTLKRKLTFRNYSDRDILDHLTRSTGPSEVRQIHEALDKIRLHLKAPLPTHQSRPAPTTPDQLFEMICQAKTAESFIKNLIHFNFDSPSVPTFATETLRQIRYEMDPLQSAIENPNLFWSPEELDLAVRAADLFFAGLTRLSKSGFQIGVLSYGAGNSAAVYDVSDPLRPKKISMFDPNVNDPSQMAAHSFFTDLDFRENGLTTLLAARFVMGLPELKTIKTTLERTNYQIYLERFNLSSAGLVVGNIPKRPIDLNALRMTPDLRVWNQLGFTKIVHVAHASHWLTDDPQIDVVLERGN